MRSAGLICVLAGHKWTPAPEAPAPQDAEAVRVAESYAGDAVLVCRRCGREKVITQEDLQPDGYFLAGGGAGGRDGYFVGGPRRTGRP